MNLVQLRAFDAVARTGKHHEAARRLYVTQPAVTSHIKALENTYDVALLRRRGRGVEPTELGRSLAAVSRELFALEERAVELLRAHERLTRGTLRITADGPYIAVPLVAEFRSRFPGVRVSVEIANTAQAQASLVAERCDVSIQGSLVEDSTLHAVELTEFDIIAFVNREHPWAHAGRARRYRSRRWTGARSSRAKRARRCDSASTRPVPMRASSPSTSSRPPAARRSRRRWRRGWASGSSPRRSCGPTRACGRSAHRTDLRYTERVVCLERRRTLAVIREFLRIAEEMRTRERTAPE